MPTAEELLRDVFGFDVYRSGQQEVVECLMAGRSAAAVFPTGGGKSLCYQLPALLLPGLTVVVSPLIALMKDQLDRLHERGIAAERLDSTLGPDQTAAVIERIRSGQLRMLYVAPERFKNERFLRNLRRTQVSLFAVDEAHCISEWGHNFRPDYLKLPQFAKECGAERVLALTATATPQVLADICHGFAIAPDDAVRTGFYRPNLTLVTTPVRRGERDALLERRLRERSHGPTIVYVTLQRTAEDVAGRLAAAGVPARAYHAGLESVEERTSVQDWFAKSNDAVVVATIAFGMGIDKANIRAVYHYNVAKSLENYSQEIGRAGRDDLPSICEMFVAPDDLNLLENFVYGDTPSAGAVRGLVRELFEAGEDFDVSLYELSERHDIRPLVTPTLLAYLELDGYIRCGTPFFQRCQFKPLATSKEILERFEGERRDFLRKLFVQAVKAKVWFHIDLDKAGAATGAPRDRILRAFDYLAELKLVELQLGSPRSRYHRLRTPDDIGGLAEELHSRTLERESREIGRVRQVLELVTHSGCQTARLADHFGETLSEPCGHCSWCTGGRKPVRVPSRSRGAIDPRVWQDALVLRGQHLDALGEPRALARFLCGMSSPRTLKQKLAAHDLFRAMGDVPFPEVLKRAEAEGVEKRKGVKLPAVGSFRAAHGASLRAE